MQQSAMQAPLILAVNRALDYGDEQQAVIISDYYASQQGASSVPHTGRDSQHPVYYGNTDIGPRSVAQYQNKVSDRPINEMIDTGPQRLWLRAFLMCSFLGASACQCPMDRDTIFKKAQIATSRDDHAEVYRLLLPLAEGGDAESQFGLSSIVDPNVGLVSANKYAETAVTIEGMWLRRAAYNGWPQAVDDIAEAYKRGYRGFPKDALVSDCFHRVENGIEKVDKCQKMELDKGYIVAVKPISICQVCAPMGIREK